jgi:pimeloyl-ACP methyl ester carboxylesterase
MSSTIGRRCLRWRGTAAAVFAAGLVAAGVIGVPTSSASPATVSADDGAAQVEAPVPDIEWMPCDDPALQCATADVPLDYDDPDGPTVALHLVRRPADNPAERIGSLFVNPGGPGGSSASYVPHVAQLLGGDVTSRFDVVGIDPRGVGGSTRAQCEGTAEPPPELSVAFPFTWEEIKTQLRWDRYYRELCATGGNPIIDHLSTADTARDMDLIRQAVGDEQLTYYGISYGTYLGATYAALFPDRIRAMVLDGVLDPVAWATGRGDEGTTVPFSARVRSHQGSFRALKSAFVECDRVGVERCPPAGRSMAKWRRIVERLQRGPVVIDGSELTYPDFVDFALGGTRDQTRYYTLMSVIDSTYRAMFDDPSVRELERARTALERLRRMIQSQPQPGSWTADQQVVFPAFHAISCADSINPSNPATWIKAARKADQEGPWFGSLWTWDSSPCAGWPGSSADAYRGPWNVQTSTPALLVGNTYDPATPISGARVVHRKLAGSRLLTMDGWGHGALDSSDCVQMWIQRYVVDSDLPAPDTVCQPNQELFPQPAAARK